MRLRVVSLAVGLCLSLPALSRADVVYTFSGDVSGARIPGGALPAGSVFSWSFSVPSLLTTDFTTQSLLTASVDGGLVGCSIVSASVLGPTGVSSVIVVAPAVLTNFSAPCGVELGNVLANSFIPVTFTAFGTYVGSFPNLTTFGTLSITPTVPEPTSLLLLGTGLLGIVGAVRRKRLR